MKRQASRHTGRATFSTLVETLVEESLTRTPCLGKQTWYRALKLLLRYGHESALDLIDHRANRAADRGDYATSARWRRLITAIHAMIEDEPRSGERIH